MSCKRETLNRAERFDGIVRYGVRNRDPIHTIGMKSAKNGNTTIHDDMDEQVPQWTCVYIYIIHG